MAEQVQVDRKAQAKKAAAKTKPSEVDLRTPTGRRLPY